MSIKQSVPYYHRSFNPRSTPHSPYRRRRGWFSRSRQRPRLVRSADQSLALPLLGRARAKSRPKLRWLSLVMSPAALLLIWGLGLIYIPYFRITQVDWHGLELITLPEAEAALRSYWIRLGKTLPGNNYWLNRPPQLEQYLNKTFSLAGVQVKKTFPNKLSITVTEKSSRLIYVTASSYYLLDRFGVILKPVGWAVVSSMPAVAASTGDIPSGSLAASTSVTAVSSPLPQPPDLSALAKTFKGYPIIYSGENAGEGVTGDRAISAAVSQGVIDFFEALASYFPDWTITHFSFMPAAEEGMVAHINKPWVIYFQPTTNISLQVENAKAVRPNANPKEYLDVRFGERVYWK